MTLFNHFEILDYPELIKFANDNFKQQATVHYINSPRQLIYADIHDDLLHTLFNGLKKDFPDIVLPDYFSNTSRRAAIGAHMTIAYDQELAGKKIPKLPKSISFQYTRILKGTLNNTFFVVEISCPPLSKIRESIRLGMPLQYKHYFAPPHMTFGWSTS